MFSGRPNPRWTADEAYRREVEQIEAGLAAAEAITPPPLGYRGFLYWIGGEERRAYCGRISRDAESLADPGRAIERLLLSTAPSALGAVMARVASLLEAPPAA